MDTTQVTAPAVSEENTLVRSDRPGRDRFDQMFGRMDGTVTIVGNIVDRDPELWNCERD